MRTRTFYHSGQLGDIIYSLPTIKAFVEEVWTSEASYVKLILGLNPPEFKSIAPLLQKQPYINEVIPLEAASLPIAFFNLDRFRMNPQIGKQHIALCHWQQFFGNAFYYKRWLSVPTNAPHPNHEPYAVINVTARYRDKFYNWSRELGWLERRVPTIFFLGLREEWDAFKAKYNGPKLCFVPTQNLLVAAELIAGARYFSSNQSSMLAIRQGLGLPYRIEQSPNHTDVNQYSREETVLNPYTRKLHKLLVEVKRLYNGK